MSLWSMTAYEAAQALQRGDISSEQLVRAAYDRIGDVEVEVRGFITVLSQEEALAAAVEVDRLRQRGELPSPLAGVPMALKDNICTNGIPTTCASRILEGYRPPYDAFVATALRQAGTILVGKANMDEFAMGSSTENSAFHTTCNPWDRERVPGGSSGGSAALVAAGEVFFALGSDTGGSIRQPASLCGVVGLKPTYGLVSRYGLIAFASSLDQIGPLTRDVRDCACVLDIIAGHDRRDSTSVPREKDNYTAYLGKEVKGQRVALPVECFGEGLAREIKDAVMQALEKSEGLGVGVYETSAPSTAYALPAYYLVAPAEASSNLARYDGIQYGLSIRSGDNLLDLYRTTRSKGFGPEVKRRIMLGTYALSSGYYDAYYLKALKMRTLIRNEFENILKDHDFIVTPTSPTVAFKIGEKDDPLTMYLNDIYTITANLAGFPAVSIPCAFVQGMPVGLQLIGRPFDEGRMLQFCYALESVLGIKNRLADVKVKGGVKNAG